VERRWSMPASTRLTVSVSFVQGPSTARAVWLGRQFSSVAWSGQDNGRVTVSMGRVESRTSYGQT
jgi:hypothetical protein